VEAGDVVVQLDDRMIQANRERTAAEQKALQEELSQAKSALKLASLEVERLSALDNRSIDGSRSSASTIPLVSPVEVKKAQVALEDAQSKLRATDAKLQAGAKDLQALDVQLQLYRLTAPRKGRLGRVQVVPGQTLSVGSMVADVVDVEDEIDVLAFVAPSIARELRLGQSARLGGLDGTPVTQADVEGTVAFIADQAEMETGNLAVKVRFPNAESRLLANAVMRVRVLTTPGKECLALPDSAIMEDQEPPAVVVVEDVTTQKNDEGKEEQVGKARRLQAVLGVRDRVLHQVEVIRLEDKEKKWKGNLEEALIVVEKGHGLQTGDAVKLEEEDED
jgi:multidrug efflux pump subunit AcrA (membrane-fusion protein)